MALLTITNGNVVLNRDLTAADDGTFAYTVTATQNGVSVSVAGMLSITATVVPPVPTAVTLNPLAMTLPDNSKAGAQVSAITVAISDGSPFTGTLDVTGPA